MLAEACGQVIGVGWPTAARISRIGTSQLRPGGRPFPGAAVASGLAAVTQSGAAGAAPSSAGQDGFRVARFNGVVESALQPGARSSMPGADLMAARSNRA